MAKYCAYCGNAVNENAVVCVKCGCPIPTKTDLMSNETKTRQQTSVILGIIGIVFAWLFALVGHVTSVIGIVIGIRAYRETNKMSGLTLSIIGEVCSIFSSIIGAIAFSGYC